MSDINNLCYTIGKHVSIALEALRERETHLGGKYVNYTGIVYSGIDQVPERLQPAARRYVNKVLLGPPSSKFLETYAPRNNPAWMIDQAALLPTVVARFRLADESEARYQALLERSDYGNRWLAALGQVDGGHGWAHARRVRMTTETLLTYTPECIHKYKLDNFSEANQIAHIVYHTVASFPSAHDLNQAESESLNSESNTNYETKLGHALAGAAQVLATEGLFRSAAQQERNPKLVHRMVAGLAIAIAVHDNPEDLEVALMGEVDAREIHNDAELCYRWKAPTKEERLNPFTISPHQLLVLLKAEKGQVKEGYSPFVTDKTPFGLGEFETVFTTELSELHNDDKPLLTDLEEPEQNALKYAIQLAVLSDQMDMFTSPPSILRKLTVPMARDIPLYAGTLAAARERVFGYKGNVGGDANLLRSLWEIDHADVILKSSELGESEFLWRFVGLNQLQALATLQRIGKVLMEGNEHAIEQLIRGIGEQEKRAQHDKLVRDIRWKKDRQGLEAGYFNNIERIDTHVQNVLNLLRQKPGGGIVAYNQEQIHDFLQLCDEIEQRIYQRNFYLTSCDRKLISPESEVPQPYTTYFPLHEKNPVPIWSNAA